jgi:aspartate/methionine/tyrosine aminotransferase
MMSTPYIRPSVEAIPDSLIRAVANAGIGRSDVIPLWFGEPDLPTPQFICDAAAAAMRGGHTKYTHSRGIPELRETIAQYMTRLYGVPVGADRITLSASGMNAIMLAMQALVGPGDNVVFTTPLWPHCLWTAMIMGGEPRAVALEHGPRGWRIDLDTLIGSFDASTRAVFLNSPGNPTGWVMPAEEQRALLAECRKRGIWIIADEVYARLIYDADVAPSLIPLADPEDRLIVINSFSKSWRMTGWRMGWFTAPARLGETLAKLTEFNTVGPATFVQHAGVVAIRDGEDDVKAQVDRLRIARDLTYQRLAAHPRLTLSRPEAAFYAFVKVDGMGDSLGFAQMLVAKHGVGVAPGAAFGDAGEGHLRLCFASSPELLTQAFDRLETALA